MAKVLRVKKRFMSSFHVLKVAISMSKSSMVVGEKFFDEWKHCSMKICAKRKNYLIHWEWLGKWFKAMGMIQKQGKTDILPKETWQSYPPALQCLVTRRKSGHDILGNPKMGDLTLPVVIFPKRRSFLLLSVLFNITRLGGSTFSFVQGSRIWIQSWIASKDVSFFEIGSENCRRDGQKLLLAMDNTLNNTSVSTFWK